jgi:hypothetical protein
VAPCFASFATAFAILVLSFVLGEVVLGTLNVFFPSPIFYDDSYNQFRVKPNSKFYGFRVNSHGFLDTEFGARRDDCVRIVALGDSFGFGVVPYEFNHLTLLEQRLSAGGACVEVLNMGIPRTGPREHLALLVNEGFDLEPDMVLLFIYVGNDLLEIIESQPRSKCSIERSRVVSLLRYALFVRPKIEADKVHDRRRYRDDKATFDEKTYLAIMGLRAMTYRPDWEGFQPALDAVVRTTARISSICKRRGIETTVIIIPDELQVNTNLQHDLAAADPRYPVDSMDFALPNRQLVERLNAVDIEVVDLLPAFRDAAARRRLYKPCDTHWNIAGNALAAELVSQHLVDRTTLLNRTPR